MANVASVYPPEFWASEGLMVLENEKVIANLVHRNFESEVASQGKIVHTRQPNLLTASDKTNDGSAVTFQAATATDIAIELRYHTIAPFYLTDRDFQTSIDALMTDFVEPAIIPIAQEIDSTLLDGDTGTFGDAYGLLDTGVVGVTPVVGDFGLPEITGTRKDLRVRKVPLRPGSVNIVLGPSHEGEALSDPNLISANFTGDTMPAIQTGLLGQKLGFNFYASQNLTDNSNIKRSVAFHKNAMTLVTRPLESPPRDMGIRAGVIEKDGLGIRVVMSWDHATLSWRISYDLLWGFRMLNAALAQRVEGV